MATTATPAPQPSRKLLQRLTLYLNFLRSLPGDAPENISATSIADGLGLGDVQVRKDLASVSSGGKPKVGYSTQQLIGDIERYLGCDNSDRAVLVGTGNLGKALLSYEGFKAYGLEIVAAFDNNPDLIGATCEGRRVLPLKCLDRICRESHVRFGIITVPQSGAQEVCTLLVDCGVQAIWNFAPVHLTAPPHVHIHNENMAASLAMLSQHLSQGIQGAG